MSLPTLIVGKEYLINSPYGKSGNYILSEVNSDKNKPLDIMYMFTDTWGNKVGFINRLFNPRGIKVILLLPPPPPHPEKALFTWNGERRIGPTRLIIWLRGELGGGARFNLMTFL